MKTITILTLLATLSALVAGRAHGPQHDDKLGHFGHDNLDDNEGSVDSGKHDHDYSLHGKGKFICLSGYFEKEHVPKKEPVEQVADAGVDVPGSGGGDGGVLGGDGGVQLADNTTETIIETITEIITEAPTTTTTTTTTTTEAPKKEEKKYHHHPYHYHHDQYDDKTDEDDDKNIGDAKSGAYGGHGGFGGYGSHSGNFGGYGGYGGYGRHGHQYPNDQKNYHNRGDFRHFY